MKLKFIIIAIYNHWQSGGVQIINVIACLCVNLVTAVRITSNSIELGILFPQ